VKERTVAIMRDLQMGDVTDFRNFLGAVIDAKAHTKIGEYVRHAGANARIVQGGTVKGDEGYFIEPTLVETDDPGYRTMCEEIFGPLVTAHVYDDAKWDETLRIVDETSPYALTGAIFSRDRKAVKQASVALRNAAGNFYINDKPTGAVVGAAAVRRCALVGHQRQGRVEAQPRAVGERAEHQGDVRPANGPPVSVHGRGVAAAGGAPRVTKTSWRGQYRPFPGVATLAACDYAIQRPVTTDPTPACPPGTAGSSTPACWARCSPWSCSPCSAP
jgi:hypothetical protein